MPHSHTSLTLATFLALYPSPTSLLPSGEWEEAGYISPTRHLSICLAVGWLEEEKREKGRKDGRGMDVKRGRIMKRNEDRGGEQ